MWLLPNVQRRTYAVPSQTLPENWSGKHTPKDILWNHHHPDTKARQRQYQKRKLHAIIFDEYICKNSQQNISKPQIQQHKKRSYITSPCSTAQETPLYCNEALAWPSKTKKIVTPQPSWIHPGVTRMVRCMQINQCCIPHNKRQKPRDDSTDAQKAFNKI